MMTQITNVFMRHKATRLIFLIQAFRVCANLYRPFSLIITVTSHQPHGGFRSVSTRLFVQKFVQSDNKDNVTALHILVSCDGTHHRLPVDYVFVLYISYNIFLFASFVVFVSFLTHHLLELTAISQTTFECIFVGEKNVFWFKFHCSLFQRAQLVIIQHSFR